ncbi:hypothetical protein PHYBLDRAFT_163940 [Phycomyces blakesleeanus NRRL 1555(-)]|uniref:Uncharacterized protein n=1 Tax=Phycomyces blakesleeanus (strain ATCC 8743b / DSM 1359 / FGSC 10004 / NBRC 33097 / NRRL 1555) TaxID=763407 RepID=A0A167Q056_PHYB8|nr:hypothetical protein PHYBLDRAFT_163940 [Phycomyces blakesleeanus NRRL 1555(-)]OAD78847.1 hypothetical protein PHYBLDRAFT_163940 [Phycomyces blakesleeanus NRRL 1555(-)]|eukprot:XP_018296887.1 hypothetical protein PHYBLDRAFT_163940 [Phycomyces blakesleeanus NRRL 1555(-)]
MTERLLQQISRFCDMCGISECIYCLTSVGVTIMTSSHKLALGLPTKLAPYRSDTVYPAMIATTLSQYEYVLICDKFNIRVSGSPQHVVVQKSPVIECLLLLKCFLALLQNNKHFLYIPKCFSNTLKQINY